MTKHQFIKYQKEHTEMLEMLEHLVDNHYIANNFNVRKVKKLIDKIKPNYDICLNCFAHHTNREYEGFCSQSCYDGVRNHSII